MKNLATPLALSAAALLAAGALIALAQPIDPAGDRQIYASTDEDWSEKGFIRIGQEGETLWLNSLTIHKNALWLYDGDGRLLGAAFASPVWRETTTNVRYEGGSVQLDFEIEVKAPLTIRARGRSADFHMIYTP